MTSRTVAVFLLALTVSISGLADVWSRSFKPAAISGSTSAIGSTRDGSLLVIQQFFNGPCVARVDSSGALAELTCHGEAMKNMGGQVLPASDGFFVYGESFAGQDGVESGFVFRFDEKGHVAWARRYSVPGSVRFKTAALSGDGGLVIAGSFGRITHERGLAQGQTALVVKLNREGKIEWQRAIDTAAGDEFWDVHVVADGVVVGGMSGFGGWIYKLQANGETMWKTLLPDRTPVSMVVRQEVTSQRPDRDSIQMDSMFSGSPGSTAKGGSSGSVPPVRGTRRSTGCSPAKKVS